MNVKKAIKQFLEGTGKNKGRKPSERYASFDYCYHYFYSFYKNDKLHELANKQNLENSCLQIGFYLASWGMMRGSSFLLNKSVKNFSNLIITISKMSSELWSIDVPNYNEKTINTLLDCKQKIIDALGTENNPSDTLITKIMLGVFANTPAFDQFFRKSLNVYTVNKKSLAKIYELYIDNKDDFDSIQIYTYDFVTARESEIIYTKAKLIDMYGFIAGQ